MMTEYDLVVVGAGPAGLFAAIHAGRKGMSVLVLEKNASAGRKLLASGSGRCNVTNAAPIDEFPSRYGNASRFVRPALLGYTNSDLMSFFEEGGVPLTEMNGGKVFPSSQRARDILDLLLDEAAKAGVAFRYSCPVDSVSRVEGIFFVHTDGGEFKARSILLSTGGKSYPGTGSTGDGYRVASELGHTIAEPGPALTPLNVKDYALADCAGISVKDAGIAIVRDGAEIARFNGDVLFTHKGLSGPGILDSSRQIRAGDVILLALAGSEAEIEGAFLAAANGKGSKTAKAFAVSLGIPERLAVAALAACGIDGATAIARLDREARKRLARGIAAMPFTVASLAGYGEAMATRGGVSLSEVNAKTMESRLVPGLFFAGEILDVDGDTGGFNLQFAFSSGKLAADAMARKRNDRDDEGR